MPQILTDAGAVRGLLPQVDLRVPFRYARCSAAAALWGIARCDSGRDRIRQAGGVQLLKLLVLQEEPPALGAARLCVRVGVGRGQGWEGAAGGLRAPKTVARCSGCRRPIRHTLRPPPFTPCPSCNPAQAPTTSTWCGTTGGTAAALCWSWA